MSNVPHPVANILIGDDWEDVVTLEQMHAYAAAVSAAKDAEIAALREDAKRWRALDAMLRHLGNPMTPTYRLVRTCSTFGDDRDVQDWRKEVDAARKGEA